MNTNNEINGWKMDAPLDYLKDSLEGDPQFRSPIRILLFAEYLIERCRRAEDQLVEK